MTSDDEAATNPFSSPEPLEAKATEAQPPVAPAPRGGPLRRLYHWVMSWSETPYGTPALAVMSFAESSVFPLPPDILQIALSVSRPRRSFFYAAVSAVASVAGAVLGWWIGYALWSASSGFFFEYVPGFSQEHFDHVGALYREYSFLAICGAAFTPIPFKIFTIAAGVFSDYISLGMLLLGSAIGRTARFMLVAVCIYFFGESARKLLERHFEAITLGLFALLIGGFVVLRWLR